MTPFITTYTGRKVNPLNIRPEDVDVRDIAHHLAILNRFVGASKRPISIAQHSLYVSRLLRGTGWEKEGLFHDAAEAYLGDVSKWVKETVTMQGYREAEYQAWRAICYRFDLRIECHDCLGDADRLMVRYEHMMEGAHPYHLFEVPKYHRPDRYEIAKVKRCELGPWIMSWERAERQFLREAQRFGIRL